MATTPEAPISLRRLELTTEQRTKIYEAMQSQNEVKGLALLIQAAIQGRKFERQPQGVGEESQG